MGLFNALSSVINPASLAVNLGVEVAKKSGFEGLMTEAGGKYETESKGDTLKAGAAAGLLGFSKEGQEIKEGLNELDAELFELEQSGEVSAEGLEGVKEQYAALKERVDDLPDKPKGSARIKGDIKDILRTGSNSMDQKLEQLETRIDRLQDVADGKDVPDRVPEGAIRVDHHYTGHDDTLMDTSMVALGKDADGFEQFAAFSPTEQTQPKAYYRDEAGNFTTNRNEAVQEFDGIATDPSILPDGAILDDKGNYWRPTGADKDGAQTFQPIRQDGESQSGLAAFVPFYQDADGNFSIKKGDDALSAKEFEKGEWEPQLPEGAVAINADGGGKVDYHMVPIGAGEGGQERYVAVQQDDDATPPDQQIYTRDENGSFQPLDGEPMEALDRPEMVSYAASPYEQLKGSAAGVVDRLSGEAPAASKSEAGY